MEKLSTGQQQLYDYLLQCQRSGEPMPTYGEMAYAMGLKSICAIQNRLDKLRRKRYITIQYGRHRNIKVYDPMTAVYVPGEYAQRVREYADLLQSPPNESDYDWAGDMSDFEGVV